MPIICAGLLSCTDAAQVDPGAITATTQPEVPTIPEGDFTSAPATIPLNYVPSQGNLETLAKRFYSVASEESRLQFLNYIKRIEGADPEARVNLVRGYLSHLDFQDKLFERVEALKDKEAEAEDFSGLGGMLQLEVVSEDALQRTVEIESRESVTLKEIMYRELTDAEAEVIPGTSEGEVELKPSRMWILDAALSYKDDADAERFVSTISSTLRAPMKALSSSVPVLSPIQKNEFLEKLETVSELIDDGECANFDECRGTMEVFELVKYMESNGRPLALSAAPVKTQVSRSVTASRSRTSRDLSSEEVPAPIVIDEIYSVYAAEEEDVKHSLRDKIASFLGSGGSFELDCAAATSDPLLDEGLKGDIRSDPIEACKKVSLSTEGDLSIRFNFDAVSNKELASTLFLPIRFVQGTQVTDIPVSVFVEHVDRPLEASVVPSIAGVEGGQVEGAITAFDPDGDKLSFICTVGCLSALDVNRGTGEFIYSPSYSDAGSHPVTFRVTAEGGTSFKEVSTSFEIENVNRAPTILAAETVNLNEGETGVINVLSFDPDGDELTYSCDNCSEISLANGRLTFTPGLSTVLGSKDSQTVISATVSVSDGELSDAKDYSFTVTNLNQAAVIRPVDRNEVMERDLIEIDLGADDPDGINEDLRYKCHAGCPKEDYSLDPVSGEFRWQPSFFSDGTYSITFRVLDGDLSTDTLVEIFVENMIRPPDDFKSSTNVSEIRVGDSLQCLGETTDIDGESLKYRYQWFVISGDGSEEKVALEGETGEFLLIDAERLAHKSVSCVMTADDGRGGITDSASADSVPVLNSDPNPFFSTVDRDTVSVGEQVVCSGATEDPDLDELSYTTRWYTKLEGEEFSLVEGMSTPAFAVSSEIAHGYIRCEMVARDGYDGETVAVTSSITEVLNTAPSSFDSSSSASEIYVNQTVTCLGETDDVDGDVLSYSYQWYRESGAELIQIEGATASDYTVSPAEDRHGKLACQVTASDMYEGVTKASVSDPITVLNSAPDDFKPTTSVAEAKVGDEITCSGTTTDVDLDPVSEYTVRWVDSSTAEEPRDISDEDGGAESTILVTKAYAHGALSCRMTAFDGFGGETISEISDPVTILNSRPEAFDAEVDVSEIAVVSDEIGSVATCSAETVDPDGDDLSDGYTFSWYSRPTPDAALEKVASGAELNLTEDVIASVRHSTLICRVSAEDGYGGKTTSGMSAEVVYRNSAPYSFSAAISPATEIRVGDTITCEGETVDPDLDTLDYRYRWHHLTSEGDIEEEASYAEQSIVISNMSSHSELICVIEAHDGLGGATDSQASLPIEVLNTDPYLIGWADTAEVFEDSSISIMVRPEDIDLDQVSAECIECTEGVSLTPLSIDDENGLVQGFQIIYAPPFSAVTPAEGSKQIEIKIKIDDGYGGVKEYSVLVTVTHVDQPPEVTVACAESGIEGIPLGVSVKAVDPDGEEVTAEFIETGTGAEVPDAVTGTLIDQAISFSPDFNVVGRFPSPPEDENGKYKDIIPRIRVSSGPSSEEYSCTIRLYDKDREAVVSLCPDEINGSTWLETEDKSWEAYAYDPDYTEDPGFPGFSGSAISVSVDGWTYGADSGGNPAPTTTSSLSTEGGLTVRYPSSYDTVSHTGPRTVGVQFSTYPPLRVGNSSCVSSTSAYEYDSPSYPNYHELAANDTDAARVASRAYHNFSPDAYTPISYHRDVTLSVSLADAEYFDELPANTPTCSFRILDQDRPPVITGSAVEDTPSGWPRHGFPYIDQYSFTATDPDGDPVSVEISNQTVSREFTTGWTNGETRTEVSDYDSFRKSYVTTQRFQKQSRNQKTTWVTELKAYANGIYSTGEAEVYRIDELSIRDDLCNPVYAVNECWADDEDVEWVCNGREGSFYGYTNVYTFTAVDNACRVAPPINEYEEDDADSPDWYFQSSTRKTQYDSSIYHSSVRSMAKHPSMAPMYSRYSPPGQSLLRQLAEDRSYPIIRTYSECSGNSFRNGSSPWNRRQSNFYIKPYGHSSYSWRDVYDQPWDWDDPNGF